MRQAGAPLRALRGRVLAPLTGVRCSCSGGCPFISRLTGAGPAGRCYLQRRCCYCRLHCLLAQTPKCPAAPHLHPCLPHLPCLPRLLCLQDRVRIEAEALAAEARYCPAHVPAVYCFDPQMCIIAMQASQPAGQAGYVCVFADRAAGRLAGWQPASGDWLQTAGGPFGGSPTG